MPVRHSFSPASARGFSLIEILVVLAIVAVLAAWAIPGYREQIARSRRTDAQTVLYEDAQYMQRYYAANNAYVGTSPAPQLPAPVAPKSGRRAYDVAITASTALTYTLTATRTPGAAMDGDRCGDLTLTQDGTQGLANAATGVGFEECWR